LENDLIDQEVYDRQYINHESVQLFGGEQKVSNVSKKLVKPLELTTSVQSCLRAFENYDIDLLPVIDDNKKIHGVISSRNILNMMTSNRLKLNEEIKKAVVKDFKMVKTTDPIKYLSKSFNRHTHILVNDVEENTFSVMVHKDLLDYYLQNGETQ